MKTTSKILPLTLVPALVAGGALAQDLTLSGPAEPMAAPSAYEWVAGPGDVAEGDVRSVGPLLQYTGVLLNVGAGVNNVFIKVQNQDGDTQFETAACYIGNNGGGFGLGFFTLDQPFTTAHLRAERLGSNVAISLTNVDGGTKADQAYVCDGAPAPEGDGIGVLGWDSIAEIDNFAAGGSVLDTFSFVGPLPSSGNWADIEPGMSADGAVASGGFQARSVWTGDVGSAVGADLNGQTGIFVYCQNRRTGSTSTDLFFGGSYECELPDILPGDSILQLLLGTAQ